MNNFFLKFSFLGNWVFSLLHASFLQDKKNF